MILFWIGVGLAPVAAALLLLSQGGGPLRVAAALAILSIVLIGLSITLRRDTGGVTAEMEATLVEELELLREDVRDDIRTAAKATHAALLREVQTLRGEVDALRGGRPQPGPVTATASVPVPQSSGLVHHTETVQVTTRQTTLTADHPHGRATPYPPAEEATRRPEAEPRWTEGRAAQPEGTEYGARPALETSRIEPSTVLGPRPGSEPAARPAEYGRRVEEDRPRWEPEPAPVRARPAEENRARPADEAPARAWQPPSPPPARPEPRRYDDSTSVSQYEPRRAEGAPRYESGFDSSSGFAPRRAEPDRYDAEPARYEPETREPSWADSGSRRAESAPPRRAELEPRRSEPEPRRAEPEPRRAEPDLRGSDIRAELRGSEPRRAEAEPRRSEPEPRRAELDVRRPEPEPGRFEMDGPTRNRRARRAEPDDEPSFSTSLPAIPRGNDPWADLRSQDAPGSTRSAGESWAEVRSDERGGEVRMGERRAELRTDEYGQELRVADRWASIRQEPAEPERATRQGPAERSGRRAANPDWDEQTPAWRAQDPGGDERTESGWSPPRDYDDSGYRARYTEEEPRRGRAAERGWQPPQEDYPREERWR
ncbi:hypothetical protein [Longispora urticae]